jgi:hypothetical protein
MLPAICAAQRAARTNREEGEPLIFSLVSGGSRLLHRPLGDLDYCWQYLPLLEFLMP